MMIQIGYGKLFVCDEASGYTRYTAGIFFLLMFNLL